MTSHKKLSALDPEGQLTEALDIIKGRWTLQVLFAIAYGDSNFAAIQKRLKPISVKSLGIRIFELQKHKLIKKVAAADGIDFLMTPKGKQLVTLMEGLMDCLN